jgi:hypothetical protein
MSFLEKDRKKLSGYAKQQGKIENEVLGSTHLERLEALFHRKLTSSEKFNVEKVKLSRNLVSASQSDSE